MKCFFKFLIIVSLAGVFTSCDWLVDLLTPNYTDEEWVVEKVEYMKGSNSITVFIKSLSGLTYSSFYSDEKLDSILKFSNICSITDVTFLREILPNDFNDNAFGFFMNKVLDPVVQKSMQFDITKIFYKTVVQTENFFKPLNRWRCRITTASMDITYVEPSYGSN